MSAESPVPSEWTPYRRDDGELLGWVRPAGELWQALDLLGRPAGEAGEYLEAEAALDDRGLGWLAERWYLGPRPVRIAEVSTSQVVVVSDEYGAAAAVGSAAKRIVLPWPAPSALTTAPSASRNTGPDRYLRDDGRIDRYPASAHVEERRALFRHLLPRVLVVGERLDERTFTDRLRTLADDPIRLRRELVDSGQVRREPDGSAYWLGDGEPLPEG